MCGLCGNNNNNPKDDLQLKTGAQATSPEELGKSWRVAEIPGCVEGCKNQSHCPSCDITQKVKYESERFCGLIKDPTGPFRKCHAIINPDDVFKNCVYDVCLYNGKKGSYCGHLRRYTVECQRKGVKVFQWRTKDFCPISKMTHPDNSHYEQCGNVCHATCENGLGPIGCKRPCEETWVCNDGFLLSGGNCVPFDQCGCMYGDKYIKKGQSFLTEDCKENCTCDGTVGFISRGISLCYQMLPYLGLTMSLISDEMRATLLWTICKVHADQQCPNLSTTPKCNLHDLRGSTLQNL